MHSAPAADDGRLVRRAAAQTMPGPKTRIRNRCRKATADPVRMTRT